MSVEKSHQSIKINLSGKPKESPQTLIFKWAITAGKMIIIVTELIALGALGYRFVVDKNIVDLHDKIKKEQLFLENQQAREKEYRGLQERLAMIKAVTEDSKSKIDVINIILDAENSGVFQSTNFVVGQKSIVISGTTPSVLTLSPLLDTLKSTPDILAVSIDEIATGGQGILFKISLELTSNNKLTKSP